jgi:outer membrane protein TolC
MNVAVLKTLTAFCIAIVFCFHISFGQQVIDIAIALEIATKNNGYIASASQKTQGKEQLALQQKAFFNPKIKTTFGDEKKEEIEQEIAFYSKRQKAYNIANYDAKIAGQQAVRTSLEVKAEVIRRMYRYIILFKKHALAEARIQRFKHLQTYINSRIFASPQKKVQKHIVETRLSLVAKQLIELEAQERMAWNELNLFLDIDIANAIIQLPFFINPHIINIDKIKEQAINLNPELNIAKNEMEQIKSQLNLAKIETMPDVIFGLSRVNPTTNQNTATQSFTLGASVPLFNQNKSKIAGLKTLQLSSQTKYNFDIKVLQNNLKSLFILYNQQKDVLNIIPISKISQGLKNLKEADANFLRDTIEFLNYIEFDMQSYDLFFAVLDAQYNYIDSYLDIMLLSGNVDISDFIDNQGYILVQNTQDELNDLN